MRTAKEEDDDPTPVIREQGDGGHVPRVEHYDVRHQGGFTGMAHANVVQLC